MYWQKHVFQECILLKMCLPVTMYTGWKVSNYGVISGLYFPAFGVNTERDFVSLRIQSEYGKIQTRNNSVFGHSAYSGNLVKAVKGIQKARSTWRQRKGFLKKRKETNRGRGWSSLSVSTLCKKIAWFFVA